MRQLIAGNWKMHGLSEDAAAIVGQLRGSCDDLACDLLVCPPFTQIAAVAGILAGSPVAVGGQDCHGNERGAHTGDISAAMLRDVGASWVIVGHSERRHDHHETDALVHAKARAAIGAGLTPIVCVGETEAQRVAGEQDKVVGAQLTGSLPAGFAGVVAYEPVWAIGTGKTASAEDAQEMCAAIRGQLAGRLGAAAAASVRLLYGGSVKPANAAEIFGQADVDGGLIGGASIVAEDFVAIARAAVPA
jgi:triosephosphate isomerase